MDMICRTCKHCDEIAGDYMLQCKHPETRKAYAEKWPDSFMNHRVFIHSAIEEEGMPCGADHALFSKITNPVTWLKRRVILASEKDFWNGIQSRYGGPFGHPLDGPRFRKVMK